MEARPPRHQDATTTDELLDLLMVPGSSINLVWSSLHHVWAITWLVGGQLYSGVDADRRTALRHCLNKNAG